MIKSDGQTSEKIDPRPLQLDLMLWGLAFLLGRASVLGSLFPFALSFHAALASNAVPVRIRAASVAAALVGAISLGSWTLGLQAVVGHLLLEAWIRRSGRRAAERSTWLGLAAILALLSGGLLRALTEGLTDYRLIVAAFQAGFVGLLFPVFSLGLAPLSHPRRFKATAMEEVISCGTLVASALIGLHHLTPLGINLQTILSSLMIMVTSTLGGAPLGAAVGAIFGVICGISAGVTPSIVASYSLSGLLAGIFKDLGKPSVGLGYILGQVIIGYHSRSTAEFTALIQDTVLAVLWYFVTPRRGMEALARLLGGANLVLGDGCAPKLAVQEVTARRLREMAQVFNELGRTFEQAAPAREAEPSEESRLTPLYGAIADRVCHSCTLQKSCWEKDFYRTYKNLKGLWAQAQGRSETGISTEEMRRQCIHPQELLATVNHFCELYRLDRYWGNRLAEGRGIVSGQLKGVSQVMEQLAEEAAQNCNPPDRRRRTKLNYLVGVSKASKSGTLISGDSHLIKMLEGGRLLVAVSDGMGAGPKAALESRATLSLLERLMETGFGSAVAIQTINSILLLRSSEENFATMDLALIDLVSGSAEFIKIGAFPSFLKRGEKVQVIKAASLPVGILNQIEVESASFNLRPGDLLLLATDGLDYARPGDPNWISDFLIGAPQTEPQVITETLLAKALEAHRGEVPDDMTVVAVRMTESRDQVSQPGGWAKVRWRDKDGRVQ